MADKVNNNTDSFTVDVTGSKTGRNYSGNFKCKIWLSFADELAIDGLRRQLLGNSVGMPTERAANEAELLANVGVRVVDGPSWFTDTNGLLNDIFDDEPLSEIYKQCVAVTAKAMDAVKKKAEDAKKNLAAQEETT